MIRRAGKCDASRIAEILVFSKRLNYRTIFQNDDYSFGELQVLPLVNMYLSDDRILQHIWVYEDNVVKGMIHVEGTEIKELYVDSFFSEKGIGAQLLEYAVEKLGANHLWALEKNTRALEFYERHHFKPNGKRKSEEGTEEYLIKLIR